ncbi:TIGR00282 family metallophosphoesterase [Nibricoccus aquaticus]|uniref:TIGR00282 family metallophosphoesterase n=1 Tax=Nibricoccus aquaticus TaxID=2576891 RepID=A0A290QLU7_9BACT|nr:TIGR00282 family metallophosphoesterase [Nibricoccus aquaticus]ATC65042.1 TIGR00282 family metallophosphoesterase [Nibricoccus aquaticus]
MLKFLFIGDVVGRPGRDIIASRLPQLRAQHGIDLVIANAENAAAGSGITGVIAKTLLSCGVDAITLGDHVWDQKGWEDEIGSFERVCRPANLPASNPGRDHVILQAKGFRLAVFTVLGRQYLNIKADCPFLAADRMLKEIGDKANGAFVEIHAEATSEKQAMGWHLDGRAIAVLGTHTHVPTADASVLPKGTAFMCDVGMTGPYASVLGREVKPVLEKFITGMPRRFEVAEQDVRLSAALVTFDPKEKRATKCELITIRSNASGPRVSLDGGHSND